MILLTWGASAVAEFSFVDGAQSFPASLGWMIDNFIPDQAAFKNTGRILEKLIETVFVSIVATVFAAGISFVLAIFGSRTIGKGVVLSAGIRLFASVLRNIPVVAWAIIFLFSFGQSTMTGFLAILVETVGFLTRAFIECIDETAESSVEALDASGASWLQVVFQSVLPSVMPQSVSWVLYMIETNIRSATLVGILTGSGIGWVFNIYYRSFQYPSAALTVLAIVVVVLLLEAVSNKIRRIIL